MDKNFKVNIKIITLDILQLNPERFNEVE